MPWMHLSEVKGLLLPAARHRGRPSPLRITITHLFPNPGQQNDRLKRLCYRKRGREWGLSGQVRIGSSYLSSLLACMAGRLGQAAGSRNPLRGSAAVGGACLTPALTCQRHRVQHDSLFLQISTRRGNTTLFNY